MTRQEANIILEHHPLKHNI